MIFSAPLFLFIIASLLTPVLNHMAVSRPEPVYEDQVSGVKFDDAVNPLFISGAQKRKVYLTGVLPANEDQIVKEESAAKPALDLATLDGKLTYLEPDREQQ
jgi:hypothetical protein